MAFFVILQQTEVVENNILDKESFGTNGRDAKKIFFKINYQNCRSINLFVPNASFLYPLKTSENLTVF